MWLLETSSAFSVPQLREFIGSHIPPYAILSHTWQDDEVTLQQLVSGADATSTNPSHPLLAKAGFRKIRQTCDLARDRDGLGYAWVDTCCIDKTSSAELTEAINSMYAFYEKAAVCYVYLSDLEPGQEDGHGVLEQALSKCRWFTRGWTLQELIAPNEVLFFDREWQYRGSKRGLASLLSFITGIPISLLRKEAPLSAFSVARRMSWVATRETTRLEDIAYCLLGIFDVNLSLIYGEGMKAFERLQTAIIQTTPDLSIFAWIDERVPCPDYAGVLAESPRQFASCGGIQAFRGDLSQTNFVITAKGIQLETELYSAVSSNAAPEDLLRAVLPLRLRGHAGADVLGISLRKIGSGLFVRYKPDALVLIDLFSDRAMFDLGGIKGEVVTLSTRLPLQLPFRGLNGVLSNRYAAIRVNWDGLPGLEFLNQHPMPMSNWDLHDNLFVTYSPITMGWCGLSIHGRVRGTGAPLQFFLGCFGWVSIRKPAVVLASLHHLDAASAILLLEQLDSYRFEASRRAERLVRTVFGEKLQPRVTDTTPHITSYWYPKGPLASNQPLIEVDVSMREEVRPDISILPALVLDVRVK